MLDAKQEDLEEAAIISTQESSDDEDWDDAADKNVELQLDKLDNPYALG